MNIESLKYFYMIAKEGNISGVAKEVHLSQSALSQQIQRLESDLNKKLLVRSNKGVSLTNAGKVVFTFADNIIRTYETMVDELEEASKGHIVLKIEACHSVADYALPCTLISANQAYPDHNYELSSNLSAEIPTNVANNICDIGFLCDPTVDIDENDIVTNKVGAHNIVLVGHAKNDLPDTIDTDMLLKACLITFTDKNNINNVLIDNLRKKGYDQNSINCNLRVEGVEGAKMLIARNFGVAFLPYISVKEEVYKKQFKIIEVPEFDMNIDIVMLYKKNCGKHVREFVEWFEKNGAGSFC